MLHQDYPMLSQIVLELGHRRTQIIDAIQVQLKPAITNSFDNDAIVNSIISNYGCQSYQKYCYANDVLSEIESCRRFMPFTNKNYDMERLNHFAEHYEPFNNSYSINTNNADVEAINCEILSATKEQDENDIISFMYDKYSELIRPVDDSELRNVLNIKNAIETYYSRCIEMRDMLNKECNLNIG
jgi:hypothetical protein